MLKSTALMEKIAKRNQLSRTFVICVVFLDGAPNCEEIIDRKEKKKIKNKDKHLVPSSGSATTRSINFSILFLAPVVSL